jgi:hypothetical protein
VAGRDTGRAALLLVVWYGLRGLVAALLSGDRRRAPAVEYAVFVVGAGAVIAARILRG